MGVRTRCSAIVTLALLAGGCSLPIELSEDFVQLRDAGQGFRAVTSDDARVWVREFYDPTDGDVSFWIGTLKNDFVDQRGYELVAEGEVQNGDGEAGRWLELTANVRGQRIDYLVAVWAKSDWRFWRTGCWVQIVEFAASHDVFVDRIDAVRASLSTVHR